MDGFDTESQHIHISLLPPDICALSLPVGQL